MVQPLPIQMFKKSKRSSDVQADEAMMDYGLEEMDEVYSSLNNLKLDIERMKFPLGTQDNPARTCKDLQLSQADYPDGATSTFTKHTAYRLITDEGWDDLSILRLTAA